MELFSPSFPADWHVYFAPDLAESYNLAMMSDNVDIPHPTSNCDKTRAYKNCCCNSNSGRGRDCTGSGKGKTYNYMVMWNCWSRGREGTVSGTFMN